MNILLIEILGFAIFAHILQAKFKIPSPVTLIMAVLGIKFTGYEFFYISQANFDNLVIVTLPLLIASDALKIHWQDIRKHAFSLFWVAVVVVILSVLCGALLNEWILFDHKLSLAAIVLLFCMVSATDPITVSAIFSNFKIPHELKVIAEGESLFNDATALIIFSFALIALNSPEAITGTQIAIKSISVIGGATVFGLLCGYLCVFCLRLSNVALVEAAFLLFFAYASYSTAEHYHFSGILAVIITLVVANKKIQDILKQDDMNIVKASTPSAGFSFNFLNNSITTKANHEAIITSIEFVCMIASAALFLSIAAIVELESVILWWKEILIIFITTTIIRALLMTKFAFISQKIDFMHTVKPHWLGVLTFAGSKGALSVLMVHMIPNSFVHKKMFETIVVGNIILSIVIYSSLLYLTFFVHKKQFAEETRIDPVH